MVVATVEVAPASGGVRQTSVDDHRIWAEQVGHFPRSGNSAAFIVGDLDHWTVLAFGNPLRGTVVRKPMTIARTITARLIVMMPLAFLAVACGDDAANDGSSAEKWGPLAVLNGPPSGDDASTAGTLRIGEECVTLEAAGGEVTLLVWPTEGTTWKPDPSIIEYSDGQETVELSDGDDVTFGGGGDSVDEGGLSQGEWVDSIEGWASEPDRSCPADVRWFVGGLPPADTTGS